jgi:hypothetical protein
LSLTTEEGYGTYASESFWGGVMVFNVTFNNISVISWRSVLLVEETGVPGENHRPAANHWQTFSHNALLRRGRNKFFNNLKQLLNIYLLIICLLNCLPLPLLQMFIWTHLWVGDYRVFIQSMDHRHLTFDLILMNIPKKSKKK